MKIKIFFALFLIIFASIEEGDFAEIPKPENCEGKDCEKKVKECQSGFWGEPCKKCECGDRADSCDYATGNCFCNSKGVIGDKCDKCDEKKLYKGDPSTGNCYYDLDSSIYVFKLTSPANKHLTKINFKFSPEDPKDDINFSINCSENCHQFELCMIAKEHGKEDKVVINKEKIEGNKVFEKILSHKDFKFGVEKEKPLTEFFIHVRSFKAPTVFNVNVIPESKKHDTFLTFYEA